tara:strand:- start:87 stop:473 length:387 start_codon:yes stop_codon:yes gene_type:complete
MFQRKPRRFNRGRTNGRNHRSRPNGEISGRMRGNTFSNNHSRNNFRPNQNVEKLFEKYNLLAKEALSAGDKTLSENYFQHADHFMRVIEEKNKNRIVAKPADDSKNGVTNNISEENKVTEEKKEDKID